MNILRRNTSNTPRAWAKRGFTLMEVMFSVMILGVGLIAIAGVLPVAGVLHRNTLDESEALAIGKAARATLLARGVKSPTPTPGVQRIVMTQGEPGYDPNYPLPLADRAYPATTEPSDIYHVRHRYYWVPVAFFPTGGGSRQVFVFIMRNPEYSYDPDNDLPGISSTDFVNPRDGDPTGPNGDAPRVINGYNVTATSPNIIKISWSTLNSNNLFDKVGFAAGSRFLDNNGFIHTVQSVEDDGSDMIITVTGGWPSTVPNPNKIYFALADINDPNPTLHIAAMGGQGVLK